MRVNISHTQTQQHYPKSKTKHKTRRMTYTEIIEALRGAEREQQQSRVFFKKKKKKNQVEVVYLYDLTPTQTRK